MQKRDPKSTYSIGDIIKHKTFGIGEVVDIRPRARGVPLSSWGKMTVQFDNGDKKVLALAS